MLGIREITEAYRIRYMFTGLIQSSGLVRALSPRQLQISCEAELVKDLAVGDSVAVDGACLTVETVTDSGFIVTSSPETLERTTLGNIIDTDWPVNLESALKVGDRLGGHFVSGHVDGMGMLQSVQQSAESWIMTFAVSADLGRYVVTKGSVAINGISLTISDCREDGTQFAVAVIPHSFAHTNLKKLTPNTAVNIETDMLGKYVAKFLGMSQSIALDPWLEPRKSQGLPITSDFLAEHGFV